MAQKWSLYRFHIVHLYIQLVSIAKYIALGSRHFLTLLMEDCSMSNTVDPSIGHSVIVTV